MAAVLSSVVQDRLLLTGHYDCLVWLALIALPAYLANLVA